MENSILIVEYIDYGIFPFSHKKEISIRTYLSHKNFFQKIVRKLLLKFSFLLLKLPRKLQIFLFEFAFNDWFPLLIQSKTIIFFDNIDAPILFKYIHTLFPDKKLILWYWNIIAGSINPKEFNKKYTELWSFDPQDCKKYGLNFNTQFYLKQLVTLNSPTNTPFDLLYVGAAKTQSRVNLIENIYNLCKKAGIIFNCHLVKSNADIKLNTPIKYKSQIEYSKVIELISDSKCILDINNSGQYGLTLRPLEALFFKKKLITNNKNIVNTLLYKLNKDNIYILSKKEIPAYLLNFINKPFSDNNYQILTNYYCFENWITRFFS